MYAYTQRHRDTHKYMYRKHLYTSSINRLLLFISIQFLCGFTILFDHITQLFKFVSHFVSHFSTTFKSISSYFSFCKFSAKSQGMLSLGLCMRSNVRQGKRLFWSSICGHRTTKSKLNQIILSL